MVRRRQPNYGIRIKRLVGLSIALLLAAQSLAAQAVTLALSTTELREGDEILLQIEVDYPTAEEVEVLGDLKIDKLQLVDGPSMQSIQDFGVAEQLRTLVQLVYRATTPGRTVLPSFEIAVAGQSFSTEPRLLSIARPGLLDTVVPPDLGWRVPVGRIYEGQSVPVLLELRNLTDFTFPDDLTVGSPASGFFQEVQGIGSVTRETIDGVELLSIPIATFILTPSQPGNLVLPTAEMTIDSFSRQAATTVVTVESLPDAVSETGAVGRFVYQTWSESSELRVGETVDIALRIEGEGNLDFFRFPDLEVPANAIVVGTREQSSFEPSDRGFSGYRQQIIELSPQTAGALEIHPPSFNWLDPATGRVVSRSAQTLQLSVQGESDEQPAEETADLELHPLTSTEVQELERFRLYTRWWVYLFLLPGPLLVAARALWRHRRKILPSLFMVIASLSLFAEEAGDLVDIANVAMEEGRYGDAIDALRPALDRAPDSPGLHYNLAVAYQQLGEGAYAIFHLRRAIQERPRDMRFRATLAAVESRYDIESAAEPSRSPFPDTYVLLGIAAWNAAFLLLTLRFLAGGGRIILATVLLIVAVGSFGVLGYQLTVGDEVVAVVGPEGGEVRRIPDLEANSWMTLPTATPVRIVDFVPPLVLVRTGYGIEGWIGEDQLLFEESRGQ